MLNHANEPTIDLSLSCLKCGEAGPIHFSPVRPAIWADHTTSSAPLAVNPKWSVVCAWFTPSSETSLCLARCPNHRKFPRGNHARRSHHSIFAGEGRAESRAQRWKGRASALPKKGRREAPSDAQPHPQQVVEFPIARAKA